MNIGWHVKPDFKSRYQQRLSVISLSVVSDFGEEKITCITWRECHSGQTAEDRSFPQGLWVPPKRSKTKHANISNHLSTTELGFWELSFGARGELMVCL